MSVALLGACSPGGTGPVASGGGVVSPSPTPTAKVPAAGFLVLARRPASTGSSRPMTVQIVDLKGAVVAGADFNAPALPYIPDCARIAPPPVRVVGGGVFFADSAGVIHRLDPSGATSEVATFRLTSSQQFLSYAVSPDGKKLMAIVFSLPALLNPVPAFPADPYVPGGRWTLDVESAAAGGPTTVGFHKDFGTSFPQTGPTLMAGWDDGGPTATLASVYCVQQQIPSVEYTGTALIHLAPDGTHLDQIGGPGCQPWDELLDGTVLCAGAQWDSFAVRARGGTLLWTAQPGCCINEPRLSPDGQAVIDGGSRIYARDSPAPASFARVNGQATRMLGWAGNHFVVTVGSNDRLALSAVPNLVTVLDLKLTLDNPCFDCLPPSVSLVGSLGIA
jgi:hypothetical protein